MKGMLPCDKPNQSNSMSKNLKSVAQTSVISEEWLFSYFLGVLRTEVRCRLRIHDPDNITKAINLTHFGRKTEDLNSFLSRVCQETRRREMLSIPMLFSPMYRCP